MSSSNFVIRPEDLGNIAEETFQEILKIWFGAMISITKDQPDRGGIDFRCIIHSESGVSHQVIMNFQIKARNIHPHESKVYKEPAFIFSLKPSEGRSIKRSLATQDPVFLVLAIPKINSPEITDIFSIYLSICCSWRLFTSIYTALMFELLGYLEKAIFEVDYCSKVFKEI